MSLATSPTRPNLEYAVRVATAVQARVASLRRGTGRRRGAIRTLCLEGGPGPPCCSPGGIGITPLKGWPSTRLTKKLSNTVRPSTATGARGDRLPGGARGARAAESKLQGPPHAHRRRRAKGWKGSVGQDRRAEAPGGHAGLERRSLYLRHTRDGLGHVGLLSERGVTES